MCGAKPSHHSAVKDPALAIVKMFYLSSPFLPFLIPSPTPHEEVVTKTTKHTRWDLKVRVWASTDICESLLTFPLLTYKQQDSRHKSLSPAPWRVFRNAENETVSMCDGFSSFFSCAFPPFKSNLKRVWILSACQASLELFMTSTRNTPQPPNRGKSPRSQRDWKKAWLWTLSSNYCWMYSVPFLN